MANENVKAQGKPQKITPERCGRIRASIIALRQMLDTLASLVRNIRNIGPQYPKPRLKPAKYRK